MARICSSSVTKSIINLSKTAIQGVLALRSILRIGAKGIDKGVLRLLKRHIEQILLALLVKYELRVRSVFDPRLVQVFTVVHCALQVLSQVHLVDFHDCKVNSILNIYLQRIYVCCKLLIFLFKLTLQLLVIIEIIILRLLVARAVHFDVRVEGACQAVAFLY